MINNASIDSSVGNQVVNKVDVNNETLNIKNRELNSTKTSSESSEEVELTEELNRTLTAEEANEVKETEKNADTLEQAFKTVSDFINVYNRNVTFSKDDESDTTVIQVFDRDTQELIKQFPSEELVELANKISEVSKDIDIQSGIFFDERI